MLPVTKVYLFYLHVRFSLDLLLFLVFFLYGITLGVTCNKDIKYKNTIPLDMTETTGLIAMVIRVLSVFAHNTHSIHTGCFHYDRDH